VSHGAAKRIPFSAVIENVVLIDEADAALGEGEKLDVHRQGALHRAFSVFAFNDAGELLLQRRALSKYHSGGLWTNTCCGHPRPGETTEDAARRRLFEELGMTCGQLVSGGVYRYRAEIMDLVENELDHLLLTEVTDTPDPNPDEVVEWRFIALDELSRWLDERPEDFTAWFPPAWRVVNPPDPATPA
jgi:isopentenyl-diphosphate delta-isomerase